jgi:integrase
LVACHLSANSPPPLTTTTTASPGAIRAAAAEVSYDTPAHPDKTAESDDTLPLPDVCVTALKIVRELQEAARSAAGARQGSELIFTTRNGTPIEPRNFNLAWDARVRGAKVPDITVHDARRTCGSLLVDLDVHPRVIMQILRHADFSITMEIYAKVSPKQTREALKKLGESLDGI